MNEVTKGTIDITIGGELKQLVCTPRAAVVISRRFGGMQEAVNSVARLDMEAIIFVATHGLQLNDRQAERIEEQVFETGLVPLVAPLVRYLNALSNGGKVPEEATRKGADTAKK